MKFVCELCGLIYDEELGDPKHGIAAGTAFSDLPQYFGCSICGSEKEAFSPIKTGARSAAVQQETATFWNDTKYPDVKTESDR